MPEGDTIHGLARRFGPLEGQTIARAEAHLAGKVQGLVGRTVQTVRARGKHLLIDVDDGTTLRVHLGMKGVGHFAARGPSRGGAGLSAEVALVIDTDAGRAQVRFPKVVDRFRTRDEPRHPVLSMLGPDLCTVDVDFDEVVRRAQARPRDFVCHLLLDQHVACGIGNVYRSELCFIARLHPTVEVGALGAARLGDIYREAQRQLRANVGKPVRTTTGRARAPLYVYGRHRAQCLVCGTAIVRAEAAGRGVWFCTKCQRQADPL